MDVREGYIVYCGPRFKQKAHRAYAKFGALLLEEKGSLVMATELAAGLRRHRFGIGSALWFLARPSVRRRTTASGTLRSLPQGCTTK